MMLMHQNSTLASLFSGSVLDLRVNMAQLEASKQVLHNPSYDAYFEKVQNRKKLPMSLQRTLTEAFASIPVSTFPEVPGGKGLNKYIYTSSMRFLSDMELIPQIITHWLCSGGNSSRCISW